MAYSTQRAVSDGTMTYLDVSINFQYQSDISVFYDDLPAGAGTWSWSSTTSKRIVFTSAIANGVEVLVKRATTMSKVINVFASGAKFNNASMDTNFQQMLFLTQEAVEGAALTDIFNDVDFHGYKILNLGDATADNQAISYGQVKTMSTGAYAAQLAAQAAQAAAEAARTLAQQWASQLTTTVDGTSYSAKQYALNASTSATAAASSATSAAGSATTASAQANAASLSAIAAANSVTAAQAAQAAAEAAAEPAQELIDGVADAQADAAAAVATANAASTIANAAHIGQCQFTNTSTTVCTLGRFNGRYLWVNGAPREIPSAGVTLSVTGLTASTFYYVYAYMNGTTLTLEPSTTTYSVDSTTGVRIKSGDSTRTLVGAVYVTSGSQFADSGANRLVLSWFNRVRKYATSSVGTASTTSTTGVIVGSGISAICWANEVMDHEVGVVCANSAGSVGVAVSPAMDSTGGGFEGLYQTYTAGANGSINAFASWAPSEGALHGFQVKLRTTATGTASISAGSHRVVFSG